MQVLGSLYKGWPFGFRGFTRSEDFFATVAVYS